MTKQHKAKEDVVSFPNGEHYKGFVLLEIDLQRQSFWARLTSQISAEELEAEFDLRKVPAKFHPLLAPGVYFEWFISPDGDSEFVFSYA